MSEQIPAGWYPDPKDTESDPRPERWWDGKGWTATTRPAPGTPADAAAGTSSDASSANEDTAVLEGTVLDGGPSVRYPELPLAAAPLPPKAKRPPRPVLVAATVAALAGLAVGSGVTYLAMDGRGDSSTAQRAGVRGHGGYGNPGDGFGGFGGQNGNGQGGGQSGGGQNGGPGQNGGKSGKGKGAGAGQAVDMVNGIALPVPSGWEGATTTNGFAALSIGEYICADGQSTCTLGGAITGKIDGTDAKAAAQDDIAKAAKESYGDIGGHQELKSEAVTVDGRAGYLVRWKVDAQKGNNGYVETVVFPGADGKSLVTVHLGFDIDPKAPAVDQMDTIVKGISAHAGGGPLTGTGLNGEGSTTT